METSANTSGLILKPGSPCIGTLGYCDIFSKCRPVDGEGPLSRLKNLLLNPVTLSAIREWVTRYWWAVMLMTVGVLVFMVAFIKVCAVHTPSSNPRKPQALKITDTLRRPIKHIPHPHLHLHRSTPSAPPAPSSGRTPTSNNKNQVVNERYSKNQKRSAKSSRQTQITSTAPDNQQPRRSSSKQSSSNRHQSSGSKSQSHQQSNGQVRNSQVSHANHISDKSKRASSSHSGRLTNMFTLKKRHKSSDPIAMRELEKQQKHHRSSSNRSANASRGASSSRQHTDSSSNNSNNNNSRSKSADPKIHSKSVNKNVEKLPPQPELVIKNVKRASKQSQSSAKAKG